jgi:lipopolysaccharide transport system permease protein
MSSDLTESAPAAATHEAPALAPASGSASAAETPSHGVPDLGVSDAGFEIVIRAGQAERLYWSDIWRYRELFLVLAYRDVSVHYKQTAIGILWALIRPLSTMLVLAFVFGKVAKLPPNGIPSTLLVAFSGMLPWLLFSTSLSEASNSLVQNANLVAKVYFPRLIVPLSSLVVSLVDFAICLPVLVILMVYYQVMPTWRLAFLPLFILLALTSSISLGLWLCALNVRYRDVRYVIPFIVQFGLFLAPVGYVTSVVPEEWRWLYSLNPMVGVIDGVRWCLFGPDVPAPFLEPSFAGAMLIVAALLLGGIRYFRRTERTFADVI